MPKFTTAFIVDSLEPRMLMAATRVAVIGDFSSDEQTAPTRDVANLVKSWSPDAVVTVGDNNYPDGAASTIDANIGQWYGQYIYPYHGSYGSGASDGVNHFWPALGNHDWNTGTDKPYTDYFTLPGNERYYTTQVGNVGLFIVDSESQEPDGTSASSVQGQWLKSALANSSATYKLVFFHHPAYSSGGMGSNTYMQWPFQQWGATAVFNGHDHDYERILKNNFPYFVDGLGGESIVGFGSTVSGSQVRYAGDYGAMKLDATDTALTLQFITRTGQVIDTYTIAAPSGGVSGSGSGAGSGGTTTTTTTSTLIPTGSAWKYLDDGADQGTAWRAISFNDSSWQSGNAQLGYGDGDEATVVSYGPRAKNKYITTYFRKTISIADPSAIDSLELNLLRDDGAVVYLNGTEVYRTNMPGGNISFTTRASTAVEDNSFHTASIDPSLLVAGNNVIAVEVHQAKPDDPDLSFDFSLSATVTTTMTTATLPAAPSNLNALAVSSSAVQLTWTDNATNETGYKIERSTNGIDFVEIAPSLGNVTSYLDSGVSAGVKYYYRVRAYNAAGDSGYSNVASATPTSGSTSSGAVLIPTGDVWKYLDDGSDQSTAWHSASFSDSTWKSGPAQLGYGDGDETTVVSYGPDPKWKYITTYFRKSFTVSNPSQITALSLSLLRDDGAVVYLNGTEIYRSNMPAGTIDYSTLAVDAVEDTSFHSASVNPALLVAGNNVIAVEVHQSDAYSSDISFDFELTASQSATTQSIHSTTSTIATTAPLADQTPSNLFNDDTIIASVLL